VLHVNKFAPNDRSFFRLRLQNAPLLVETSTVALWDRMTNASSEPNERLSQTISLTGAGLRDNIRFQVSDRRLALDDVELAFALSSGTRFVQ
jgi:hypothetical protein